MANNLENMYNSSKISRSRENQNGEDTKYNNFMQQKRKREKEITESDKFYKKWIPFKFLNYQDKKRLLDKAELKDKMKQVNIY